MLVVCQNEKDHGVLKEMSIHVKQATALLMKCNNSFKEMVAELLVVRNGQITLANLSALLQTAPEPVIVPSETLHYTESDHQPKVFKGGYCLNQHSSAMMTPANASSFKLNDNSSIKMMPHEHDRNINNCSGNTS